MKTVFLSVYCEDVLVHLKISFDSSNSQHGCCERCTSDMDVRVRRCVRIDKPDTKSLDELIHRNLNAKEYCFHETSAANIPQTSQHMHIESNTPPFGDVYLLTISDLWFSLS